MQLRNQPHVIDHDRPGQMGAWATFSLSAQFTRPALEKFHGVLVVSTRVEGGYSLLDYIHRSPKLFPARFSGALSVRFLTGTSRRQRGCAKSA